MGVFSVFMSGLLPVVVESSTVKNDSSSLVSCWHRLQAWQKEIKKSSEIQHKTGTKKKAKQKKRERKEISVLNSGKALSVSVNEAQFGSSSTSGSMLEER